MFSPCRYNHPNSIYSIYLSGINSLIYISREARKGRQISAERNVKKKNAWEQSLAPYDFFQLLCRLAMSIFCVLPPRALCSTPRARSPTTPPARQHTTPRIMINKVLCTTTFFVSPIFRTLVKAIILLPLPQVHKKAQRSLL